METGNEPARRRSRKRRARKSQAIVASKPSSPQTNWKSGRIGHLSLFEGGRWMEILQSSLSIEPCTAYDSPLRVMTYNTHSGSSTRYSSERTTALLDILQHSNLDIIALQEVTPTFNARLLGENWVRKTWVVSDLNGFMRASGDRNEGCMVLVKAGLAGRGSGAEFVKLMKGREDLGKALIVLKLWSGGMEKLRIITSHFTPLPDNAPTRHMQYTLASSLLTYSSASTAHLLLADFNNSSHEEIASAFPSLHDTVSPLSDPFRDDPTFGQLYPFIPGAPKSRPRKLRRIDRILIGGEVMGIGCEKGKVGNVRVGMDPLVVDGELLRENKGNVFPSDHCGVLAVVRVLPAFE